VLKGVGLWDQLTRNASSLWSCGSLNNYEGRQALQTGDNKIWGALAVYGDLGRSMQLWLVTVDGWDCLSCDLMRQAARVSTALRRWWQSSTIRWSPFRLQCWALPIQVKMSFWSSSNGPENIIWHARELYHVQVDEGNRSQTISPMTFTRNNSSYQCTFLLVPPLPNHLRACYNTILRWQVQ